MKTRSLICKKDYLSPLFFVLLCFNSETMAPLLESSHFTRKWNWVLAFFSCSGFPIIKEIAIIIIYCDIQKIKRHKKIMQDSGCQQATSKIHNNWNRKSINSWLSQYILQQLESMFDLQPSTFFAGWMYSTLLWTKTNIPLTIYPCEYFPLSSLTMSF